MDLKDRQTSKNTSFWQSLRCALQGCSTALKEEKNMRVHVVATVLVVAAGFLVQLTLTEWLFLLTAIAFVLVAELVNTACEALVDLCTEGKFHPLAKKSKDLAAAAVLLAALYAGIIGVLIFVPKLFSLFK